MRFCTWCCYGAPLLVVVLVARTASARTHEQYMRVLSYGEINNGLMELARRHSHYLRVYSAAQAFPVIPGSRRRCGRLSPNDEECETLIADFNSAAPGSPAVLVAGPLHGDEPIAASAAYNLVNLLLIRAEADPWISRLLATRRIIIVPLPSAAAYSTESRLESLEDGGVVDPEADFPFAHAPSKSGPCLQSRGSRIIDALFEAHTFVVALQLRESVQGRDSVTFSWASDDPTTCSGPTGSGTNASVGTAIHRNEGRGDENPAAPCKLGFSSPDDKAMRSIAKRMAAFAGPSQSEGQELSVGAHNEIYAPTSGGFLDYAYASSARRELVSACAGRSKNASHRAASFALQMKKPRTSDGPAAFGRLSQLYYHEPQGNTITRMLRAALVGIDVASPYVFWLSAEEDEPVDARGGIAHVRWSIGGAVSVAETWLTCRIGTGDSGTEWSTRKQAGGSIWSQDFEDSRGLTFFRLHTLAAASYEFRASLNLFLRMTPEQRRRGTRLFLRADAIVDDDWLPSVASSPLPMSHLVQLRSNDSWQSYDSNGQPLPGRRIVSTETLVVHVPPVSGFAAFLYFVWEFLVLAAFLCIAPPAGLILCAKRLGASNSSGRFGQAATNVVRQRLRWTWRNLTRGELVSEVARARGGNRAHRRNVSMTNLLGMFSSSNGGDAVPKNV